MIIVVDDERTFARSYQSDIPVLHLRTTQEALAWFANYITNFSRQPAGSMYMIEEIWFDHDLGEKSCDDAIQIARFVALFTNGEYMPSIFQDTKIYIHSQNPVGAENIRRVFEYSMNKAEIVPLPELI